MIFDLSLYFQQWLLLIAVFSLAVVSPGPDFVVAVRNSLVYSRRAGLFTAAGFAIGSGIHVTYTLLGIAAIIAQSIIAFNIIKWFGAAYLIYIGINALRSKGVNDQLINQPTLGMQSHAAISDLKAFQVGLMTNILNPKAAVFFLSVFTQIVSPTTPLSWKAFYGLTVIAMVMAWFSFVALVLTHPLIRARFIRFSKWIDRSCGAIMVGLGIKVALTSR